METISFHYLTIKQLPDVYQFYLGAVCAFFGIIGILNAVATCAIVYKMSKEKENLIMYIGAQNSVIARLKEQLGHTREELKEKGGGHE